jgi:hypothetical protein
MPCNVNDLNKGDLLYLDNDFQMQDGVVIAQGSNARYRGRGNGEDSPDAHRIDWITGVYKSQPAHFWDDVTLGTLFTCRRQYAERGMQQDRMECLII